MGTNNQTKKGTPRKKTSVRKDDPSEEVARSTTPSPTVILVLVVVAVLSVAGFALWRNFTREEPAPQAVQEEEPKHEPLDPKVESKLERVMSELTLEQKVAQLFVVQPEDITGVDTVVAAGDTTREAIMKYPVGGIIYNTANLVSPEQTKEMIRNSQYYAKDSCGLPLFTCVDEEGGTVARIASNEAFGVANVGDAADLGATGDPEKARDAAYTMGSYLAELGLNVDFAPVADIATSEDGTMAARSFGSSPDVVSPMVAAQVKGFTRAGILCSAKHFPGIGDAEGDSHNVRIYSQQTEEEMLKWSCLPFQAAMDEGVPMIMVGHLSCLKVGSGEGDLPASLSPAIIDGLLRKKMGYDGLVITDALEMEAAADACDADEQAVLAIKAGADLVLIPKDFEEAYDGLLAAVKNGEVSEDRIDESVRRIVLAKMNLNV